MAIGTAAAVIGGASLLGAGASVLGSRSAAKAQTKASDKASSTQLAMYEQSREDSLPFMRGGETALSALQFELGLGTRPNNIGGSRIEQKQWRDGREYFETNGRKFGNRRAAEAAAGGKPFRGFEATPGYAFMRDQGTRAIDASAAARGMTRSGATLKAQERFGQGIAAQEYNTYLNRLQGMSGFGQTSTNQIGALGAATAGQVGNNALFAGNARASAYQNMGNAVNNFAGNALGAAAYSGYLKP